MKHDGMYAQVIITSVYLYHMHSVHLLMHPWQILLHMLWLYYCSL